MENIKNILVAGLVALVISAGAYMAVPKTVVQNVVQETKEGKPLGAVASPDIPSSYVQWGGIRTWQYAMKPNQATSSLCSFLSPAATSTLASAGISLDVSSTTAGTLYIAKGANSWATTTLLANTLSLAANAKAFHTASTTPIANSADNSILAIAPLTYVNIQYNGGASAASGVAQLAPQGVCHATFEEYSAL